MKFELKDYQNVAASKILVGLRRGSQEFAQNRDFTAVSLSAPTGSGKTVIAAAVIEQVFFGDIDGEHSGDPNAIFLWLTDDPSLNEQTRKKILEASDRIQHSQLITIDDGLDQPELEGGKLYFLNIQKLAKHSNLTRSSNDRRFSIWEILANTVSRRGPHYYLVIDEAHRGTGTRLRNRQTLAQRLISDAEGVLPPAPVVWGISATPERFDAAMSATRPERILRPVKVPINEVRESGLLKDVLSIHHQGEDQQMDVTLIRAAARSLREFDDEWRAYTESEDEPLVKPILVVQIPPNFSEKSTAELLATCTDEWEVLDNDAIAHSLESHTAQEYGSYTVKYVAPQDIEDKTDVRLVLFKEALTTGWDCPRAEVMLSLRPAKDDTYIAQLIGRMVRAPLARRIVVNEKLNRVRLFLPKFDSEAVLAVKDKLETDPEGPPSTITINSVDAVRNSGLPDSVFEAFENLPTYVVPGPVHRSQVGRLHKLSALLVGDGLMDDAINEADKFLVSVLESESARLKSSGLLEPLVDDVRTADVAVSDIELHSQEKNVVRDLISVRSDAGDIDRIFRFATRQFRDGLAHTFWAHRVTNKDDEPYDAKVLTIALSREPSVVQKVERDAEERVKQLLRHFGSQISALSDDQRAKYSEVRAMAQSPEEVDIALPSVITMPQDDPPWLSHLFSDSDGNFNAVLGGWEADVLKIEQSKANFVAWYRNPTGGERALRVPFEIGGVWKSMYPDFVFFSRDSGGSIRPSIVDPHGHHLSDTAAKWRGLAAYASKHGNEFHRVEAIIKDEDNQYVFLDLKDATVRESLDSATTKEDISRVFREFGGVSA